LALIKEKMITSTNIPIGSNSFGKYSFQFPDNDRVTRNNKAAITINKYAVEIGSDPIFK
jgi:hypothetical protein